MDYWYNIIVIIIPNNDCYNIVIRMMMMILIPSPYIIFKTPLKPWWT